jgi:hypothetical protein
VFFLEVSFESYPVQGDDVDHGIQLRLEGGGRRVKLLPFSVLTYFIENFIGNQNLFTESKNI